MRILKESGKRKGKNLKKTLMKETGKPLTKLELEQLEIKTFSNCVIGSYYKNGVTWNKIKRLKGRNKKSCLKQLSLQKL